MKRPAHVACFVPGLIEELLDVLFKLEALLPPLLQHQRVQALLRRGADADRKGPTGDAALTLAAVKGHRSVVRLLLQARQAATHRSRHPASAAESAASAGDGAAVAAPAVAAAPEVIPEWAMEFRLSGRWRDNFP